MDTTGFQVAAVILSFGITIYLICKGASLLNKQDEE